MIFFHDENIFLVRCNYFGADSYLKSNDDPDVIQNELVDNNTKHLFLYQFDTAKQVVEGNFWHLKWLNDAEKKEMTSKRSIELINNLEKLL